MSHGYLMGIEMGHCLTIVGYRASEPKLYAFCAGRTFSMKDTISSCGLSNSEFSK